MRGARSPVDVHGQRARRIPGDVPCLVKAAPLPIERSRFGRERAYIQPSMLVLRSVPRLAQLLAGSGLGGVLYGAGLPVALAPQASVPTALWLALRKLARSFPLHPIEDELPLH